MGRSLHAPVAGCAAATRQPLPPRQRQRRKAPQRHGFLCAPAPTEPHAADSLPRSVAEPAAPAAASDVDGTSQLSPAAGLGTTESASVRSAHSSASTHPPTTIHAAEDAAANGSSGGHGEGVYSHAEPVASARMRRFGGATRWLVHCATLALAADVALRAAAQSTSGPAGGPLSWVVSPLS